MSRPANPLKPLDGYTAVVLGGSNGGLGTALALASRGMHVRIREQAKDPYAGGRSLDDPLAMFDEARGGALLTRPETRQIYRRWGVRLEPGIFISSRRQDRMGRIVERGAPNAVSSLWDGVARSMRRAGADMGGLIEYEGSRPAKRLLADWGTPGVIYDDGTTETADLVVDATGEDSLLGEEFFPTEQNKARVYAGYTVWRGQFPTLSASRTIRDLTRNALHEVLRSGRGMNMLPVLTPVFDGSRQDISWAICDPVDEDTLRGLLDDRVDRGFVPHGKVPDAAIEHLIRTTASTGDSSRGYPSWVSELVENPGNTYFARIIKDLPGRALPDKLVAPGIAEVGQRRGGTSRPFSARATRIAAQDAEALAESLVHAVLLGRPLQHGLESYERNRLPAKREEIERTRELDEAIGLPSPGRSWGPSRRSRSRRLVVIGEPVRGRAISSQTSRPQDIEQRDVGPDWDEVRAMVTRAVESRFRAEQQRIEETFRRTQAAIRAIDAARATDSILSTLSMMPEAPEFRSSAESPDATLANRDGSTQSFDAAGRRARLEVFEWEMLRQLVDGGFLASDFESGASAVPPREILEDQPRSVRRTPLREEDFSAGWRRGPVESDGSAAGTGLRPSVDESAQPLRIDGEKPGTPDLGLEF